MSKKKSTRGEKTTACGLITSVHNPNGEWFSKPYETLDAFLSEFTPHVKPSGSFLERLKYVFDCGGDIDFKTKQHNVCISFFFYKEARGGYRENAKRPKKFPDYDTKYIKVLTPYEFESGLKKAIDAYLDRRVKEDKKQKAEQS